MSPAKSKPKAKAKAKAKGKLSAVEREAMKETLRERSGPTGLPDLLAKIAEMAPADRALAEKLHAGIMKAVPSLEPRTWYGMPAYAKDGDVICFFQSGAKFKTRYATFGFSHHAKLDDGAVWPTGFALLDPSAADLAKLVALVVRAVS